MAVLYVRHHGTAEGGDAEPPQPPGDDDQLLHRHRPAAARRQPDPCRAAQPWFGALHVARPGPGQLPGDPCVRPFRSCRTARAVPPLAACVDVRGADDGQASGRPSGRRKRRARQSARRGLGRGADVRGRHRDRAGAIRLPVRAALWPGRVADDDHRHEPGDAGGVPSRRGRRRDGVRRLAAERRPGAHRRFRRPAAAGRRAGRDPGPRRQRHGGLLAQSRRERGGAARRLAAHGGCRRARRPRAADAARPLQGPDHLWRRQHLSARGRGDPAAPCRRRGMRRDRGSRRGLGRERARLRRAARARRGRSRRARSPVPRQHRAVQAAQGISLRRRPAEEQLRQGPEDRAARAPPAAERRQAPAPMRSRTSWICARSW